MVLECAITRSLSYFKQSSIYHQEKIDIHIIRLSPRFKTFTKFVKWMRLRISEQCSDSIYSSRYKDRYNEHGNTIVQSKLSVRKHYFPILSPSLEMYLRQRNAKILHTAFVKIYTIKGDQFCFSKLFYFLCQHPYQKKSCIVRISSAKSDGSYLL